VLEELMEVDPVVVAMIPGGVAGFTALWYKLGRVESKLDSHLQRHIREDTDGRNRDPDRDQSLGERSSS